MISHFPEDNPVSASAKVSKGLLEFNRLQDPSCHINWSTGIMPLQKSPSRLFSGYDARQKPTYKKLQKTQNSLDTLPINNQKVLFDPQIFCKTINELTNDDHSLFYSIKLKTHFPLRQNFGKDDAESITSEHTIMEISFGNENALLQTPATDGNCLEIASSQSKHSKRNVGRHFLKVHMKKCLKFAFQHRELAENTLSSVLFAEQQNGFALGINNAERFIQQQLTQLMSWLQYLQKKLRDYGKQDFKDAYLGERIAMLADHHSASGENMTETESKVLFFSVNYQTFQEWVFKETFRRISLVCVQNNSLKGSLKQRLQSSSEYISLNEHYRYMKLTEWLLESPSRIETAQIYGKNWVEKFFQDTAGDMSDER